MGVHIGGWLSGRYDPIHFYGPSGSTPELGSATFIKGMKMAYAWDLQTRSGALPDAGSEIVVHGPLPRREVADLLSRADVATLPSVPTKDGKKELVAVEDGYRESAESWRSVLRSVQERGLDGLLFHRPTLEALERAQDLLVRVPVAALRLPFPLPRLPHVRRGRRPDVHDPSGEGALRAQRRRRPVGRRRGAT